MEQKQNDLKYWLATLIDGEFAHVSLESALKDLPHESLGVVPEGLPYSIWQLAEHIRIAQWDILEFSKNRKHQSPKWPDNYWPVSAKPLPGEWEKCLNAIKKDREEIINLILDPSTDLLTPFPDGNGQNLLREALLILDHNAYHTGQIILIRKLLGIWNG